MERSLPAEVKLKNISTKFVEKMARGAILGYSQSGAARNRQKRLNNKVEVMVSKKGKHLVDKMFELAEGIYMTNKVSGKEMRYYQVPPNFGAITYLLDRVLGKPKVAENATEANRGVIAVEQIIKRLADGTTTEERKTTFTAPAVVGGSDGEGNDDEGFGEESV